MRQLLEEEVRQTRYARLRVLQAPRDARNLALDLRPSTGATQRTDQPAMMANMERLKSLRAARCRIGSLKSGLGDIDAMQPGRISPGVAD